MCSGIKDCIIHLYSNANNKSVHRLMQIIELISHVKMFKVVLRLGIIVSVISCTAGTIILLMIQSKTATDRRDVTNYN